MKKYIKLLRVKHYIKNLLVFLPVFFGKAIFESATVLRAVLGCLAFCAVSSAVYILNDIRDVESDRKHPTKKDRPLAAGEITVTAAGILFGVCILVAAFLSLWLNSAMGVAVLALYLVLNIGYSLGLKNVPIADVVILASGFVLRVFYGGFITDIVISDWLYLVIISASLYLGLGKRRNEMRMLKDEGRKVLKYYTIPFLDKNMYVCMALTNVFYALWTMDLGVKNLVWTVPFFLVIFLYYSMVTEGDSDGDPVEVVLHHKAILVLSALYVLCMFGLLYFGR